LNFKPVAADSEIAATATPPMIDAAVTIKGELTNPRETPRALKVYYTEKIGLCDDGESRRRSPFGGFK